LPAIVLPTPTEREAQKAIADGGQIHGLQRSLRGSEERKAARGAESARLVLCYGVSLNHHFSVRRVWVAREGLEPPGYEPGTLPTAPSHFVIDAQSAYTM